MSFDRGCLRLYLVTDRTLCGGRSLVDVVRHAVAGGVSCVQVREKDAPGSEFLCVARDVARILEGTGVPLLINDRVDVAACIPGAGVHLGQEDLPLVEARRILGPDRIIGISASSIQLALQAEADGADYIGSGPAFPTSTKLDTDPVMSREELAAIAAAVHIPVVAIGGIGAGNLTNLKGLGLAGVAVVSAICAAPDPELAARELSLAW